MSEQKFKKGDLLKIRTSGETVMAVGYKVNYAGGVMNAIDGGNRPDSVITDLVLCEGTIDKKFQRKFIAEANLEIITN